MPISFNHTNTQIAFVLMAEGSRISPHRLFRSIMNVYLIVVVCVCMYVFECTQLQISLSGYSVLLNHSQTQPDIYNTHSAQGNSTLENYATNEEHNEM